MGVTSGSSSATAGGFFLDFEAQIPPVAIFPVQLSFQYVYGIQEMGHIFSDCVSST